MTLAATSVGKLNRRSSDGFGSSQQPGAQRDRQQEKQPGAAGASEAGLGSPGPPPAPPARAVAPRAAWPRHDEQPPARPPAERVRQCGARGASPSSSRPSSRRSLSRRHRAPLARRLTKLSPSGPGRCRSPVEPWVVRPRRPLRAGGREAGILRDGRMGSWNPPGREGGKLESPEARTPGRAVPGEARPGGKAFPEAPEGPVVGARPVHLGLVIAGIRKRAGRVSCVHYFRQ